MKDDEVEELLQEINKMVRSIAQGYFSDSAVVEDAVQEHALTIWGLRRELDSAKGARAYAIHRAHYVCLRIKQARYQRQPELEPLEQATEAALRTGGERSHLRDLAVRQAFDKLPTHLWVVAWLVHGEGFLVSETARRLRLPRLLTEQRLQEATKRLQLLLKDWR